MYGICKFCGCTDHNACVNERGQACSWINNEHDICSACEGKDESANMPNQYNLYVTEEGFIESLYYQGKAYLKRYQKDATGYIGLDKAWEYESLPDELIEALDSRDPLEIMNLINK